MNQRTTHCDSKALTDAVYAAVVDLMNAVGQYPTTRAEIIDAIGAGAERAFRDLLAAAPVDGHNER